MVSAPPSTQHNPQYSVLLVDDNPINRKIGLAMLRRILVGGFKVRCSAAASGKEALAMLFSDDVGDTASGGGIQNVSDSTDITDDTDEKRTLSENTPCLAESRREILTRIDSVSDTLIIPTGQRQSQHKFDAILMDQHMPGMSGYETTLAIRLEEARRNFHRICICCNSAGTLEVELNGQGMDYFLPKPYGLAQLEAQLTVMLERK